MNYTTRLPTSSSLPSGSNVADYINLRNELIHRENQMASITENISNKDEYTKAYYS